MKRISTIFIILLFSQNILSAINNPFLLINKDLHDGFLTDVKAVELKARTLLIPESLPARYQFEEPDYIPCGLGIIDDAQEYYDQLPGDLQIKLDNINNDIDERSNDRVSYFTPEGNVQLNYQLTGEDGLTGSNAQDNDNSGHPDFVENMGQYIEDALAVYIDLGWINPLTCTSNSMFLVTIEYQSGTYGYVPGSSYHRIYMSKNLSDSQNKLTTSHELHHLVQHAYTGCDGDPGPSGSWYRECSSQWAEEIVWDELNGYEGYDQAFQNEPYRSLDYFESGGLYQYGSTIWNLYIHENFGDSAVKNIWETPISGTISAINNYFINNGSNFVDEFTKFSAWRHFTGSRSHGNYYEGEFEEASNISPVAITRTATGALVNYTPPSNKLPDDMGVNYVKINRGSGSQDNLLIQFDGDSNYNWKLKVFTHQGTLDDGFEIPVDINADGFAVLNNWTSYNSATINPIVTSTSGANANYILTLMSIENLLLLDDIEFNVSGDNAYPDPGETISLIVTVANYGNNLSSVLGEISTNHSGITISDATTQFGTVATNEQSDNTADPFIIDISENVDLGVASFDITLTFDGNESITEEWSINIGIPPILLVDDDNGDNTEDVFIEGMDSLNVSFEILDRTSTPLDDLNLDIRDIVIWNTGSADGNGLSAVEKNVIMEYLDSGKNLFLSGSHLGEELADSELLNNYLEMRYAGFRTGGILRGVEGDPIGVNSDNKLFLSLGSVGIDSLSTFGDPRASLSFYYNGDESHGAVMRYSSPDYRVILSSFNMDAVSPPNSTFLSEKDYIYSVLNYLVSDVEYPDVPTLLLPAAGYADTLTSSDDNISFSWNSSDLEGINTFFILDDPEFIRPIFTFNMQNEVTTVLAYDTLLSLFGYVDNKELYWGVYSNVNGEVSISDLNSFEITLMNELSVDDNINIPKKYQLSNVYPNPFNPRTSFTLSIPKMSFVSIKVFDLIGREIAIIAQDNFDQGIHKISWDGTLRDNSIATSGVYLLIVEMGEELFSKKLILMK
ncbi:T9SS type A sorting domain-containing protein [bacterium]|nr:MAG: T9SS type A sorting domain-containing protein [bacterium]